MTSSNAESYMRGWSAGYHNATLAERKRILQIVTRHCNEEVVKKIKLQIESAK